MHIHSPKELFKSIYHSSPLLFIMDAYFQRILRYATINSKSESDRNHNRNIAAISSLSEMLTGLKKCGAVIYGENIIENYEELPQKTILLISHELTLTGAPLVFLNAACCLKNFGYQTILISSLNGEKFAKLAPPKNIPIIYYPGLYKNDYILSIRKLFTKIFINTNSCELTTAINSLSGTDSEVIWWIHEAKESYKRGHARVMPRRVSDNIHIYAVGPYAIRQLKLRFPHYKVHSLIYGSADIHSLVANEPPSKSSTNDNFGLIDNDSNKKNKKVYAVIGSVTYRKGQDILINSINRLPNEVRDNSIFLFIGKMIDKPIYLELNKLIKRFPNSVRYINELSPDEVYRLYNHIDFLICPSRDDPLPVVIAEAMSMGIPSLCSCNTGSAPIIRKYQSGFTYGDNSPKKLAKLIEISYHTSDTVYKKMSLRARLAYEKIFSETIFENKLRIVTGGQAPCHQDEL